MTRSPSSVQSLLLSFVLLTCASIAPVRAETATDTAAAPGAETTVEKIPNSKCFRCHDDAHSSAAGGKITQDCNACHGTGTTPGLAASLFAAPDR